MSASVPNNVAAHLAEMNRTHGAAAGGEMAHMQREAHSQRGSTPKTHTYNTPHDAWAHAIELHKRGAISTQDLHRVRHELESHLSGAQAGGHMSLAALGRLHHG